MTDQTQSNGAVVIQLPTTVHADRCKRCGQLARLFIMGVCERCSRAGSRS